MLENAPLLIILVVSTVFNNNSVAIAATFLLLIKLLGFTNLLPIFENNGVSIGIIILTIAILSPLASGKITLKDMSNAFLSPLGIATILCGVFTAWAAGKGLMYTKSSPDVVVFLVLGTVIGVSFFNGVAVGPLTAGGLAWLIALAFGAFR